MHPFVAIDFETADAKRDSACAVGLVRVEEGKIVYKESVLIKPPRSISSVCYAVHGISWNHVKDAPPFSAVWPKLSPVLKGARSLVAHNASFDKSVLEACCRAASLASPSQDWVCTLGLARQRWPKPLTNTLPDVCARLGITFKNHHETGADAEAAALVLLAIQSPPATAPCPSSPPIFVPTPADPPAWVPHGEAGAILDQIPKEQRTPAVLALMRDAESLGPLHAADLVACLRDWFASQVPRIPRCQCGGRATVLCDKCLDCIALLFDGAT